MASPLKKEDRLDELARDIRLFSTAIVDQERAAGELSECGLACDGEDAPELLSARLEARALEVRLRRDQALIAYFEENERARASKCPIHGPQMLIASCPDCCKAWNYSPSRVA